MRLYVYVHPKAKHSLAVIEVTKLSKTRATVPRHINLNSIKPGMICCPAEGRQPDREKVYSIIDVVEGALIFEGAAVVEKEKVTHWPEHAPPPDIRVEEHL